MRDQCLLMPHNQQDFMGNEYWLIVPCNRLEDKIGEWGITPDTFYENQAIHCELPQGIRTL